jgi:hypothetical protein
MRKFLIISFIALFYFNSTAQEIYNNLPLIQASDEQADFKIGSDCIKGGWRISPHIKADTMRVNCYSNSENFTFLTDVDSISFTIKPGKSEAFYVLLDDSAYAFTVVSGVKPNLTSLEFEEAPQIENLNIVYEQASNNKYLARLRSEFPIDSLINGVESDTEKALKILHWVNTRWKHNGNNTPKKKDAISILKEAEDGKNFRCVEYGIVATACLNSVGLTARTLGLKTKDVETRKSGAGHVLLEVYLPDLQKWAVLDGQWDIMPILNGKPLNAVEFQKAITNNYHDIKLKSSLNIPKRQYIEWIYPYLFYFDVSLDNREGTDINKKSFNGKSRLMLVPKDAENPEVFQIKYPINNCLYTNSMKDFYGKPNIER